MSTQAFRTLSQLVAELHRRLPPATAADVHRWHLEGPLEELRRAGIDVSRLSGELAAVLPATVGTGGSGDLRKAAAWLAASVYGVRTVASNLVLLNLAALTVLMRPRLVVHRLTEGAVRLVHETDLHSLPGEPPRLLRGPFVLETKDPARYGLFAGQYGKHTACLAGYAHEGTIYLIGLEWPDGAFVGRWHPDWTARDLDATVTPDMESPLIADIAAHQWWTRDAARFAVVLGLLLDAERTPVVTETTTERARARRASPGGQHPPSEWIVRRIYLRDTWPYRPSAFSAASPQPMDLAGRIPQVVAVTGHLKRQAVGPRYSQHRWIYVRAYQARRWLAPRPLQMVVSRQVGEEAR